MTEDMSLGTCGGHLVKCSERTGEVAKTFLKAGDTAPAFRADLNADITGATASVRFSKLDGTFVMVRPGVITDATNGIVQYQWVVANDGALINNAGAYRADVMITFADTRIETFPQRSYLEIVVRQDVPAA
jgi:hypothetical protein